MEEEKKIYDVSSYEQGSTPWKPMVGFSLSIILTAVSLWGVFYSDYAPTPLLAVIAILSFLQALIQLFNVQERSS